jgi:hypothetical protein
LIAPALADRTAMIAHGSLGSLGGHDLPNMETITHEVA